LEAVRAEILDVVQIHASYRCDGSVPATALPPSGNLQKCQYTKPTIAKRVNL
jgi:hypothetical protein